MRASLNGACSARSDSPDSARRSRRAGFTIVELVVAVVVLSIGLLGLAGTSAVVLRQMKGAKEQLTASQVAASRIENLSGNTCPKLALVGSASTLGVGETWVVIPTENSTMLVQVAVTFSGRTNPEYFRTVVACF